MATINLATDVGTLIRSRNRCLTDWAEEFGLMSYDDSVLYGKLPLRTYRTILVMRRF
jgi:hypothetical protein